MFPSFQFLCSLLLIFFPIILASLGHGLLFKTKYEKSLLWQSSQRSPELSQKGDVDGEEAAVLKEADGSAA